MTMRISFKSTYFAVAGACIIVVGLILYGISLWENRRVGIMLAPNPEIPLTNEIALDADIETIRELIYHLRHNTDPKACDNWAPAVKALANYGQKATPEIVAELLRDKGMYSRSALCFALRAINDQRAIPGLIGALYIAPFGFNDYGTEAKDPEVDSFMAQHDNNPSEEDSGFSFGRPVREVNETLKYLTKHTVGDDFVGIPRYFWEKAIRKTSFGWSQRRKNMFIRNRGIGADRWQDWWDQNKSTYLSADDLRDADAWLELAKTDPIEAAGKRHETNHDLVEPP